MPTLLEIFKDELKDVPNVLNQPKMKTIAFKINKYYSRSEKRQMYQVSILEEINADATEGNNKEYSVRELFNKDSILYKKDAKKLLEKLKLTFFNTSTKLNEKKARQVIL